MAGASVASSCTAVAGYYASPPGPADFSTAIVVFYYYPYRTYASNSFFAKCTLIADFQAELH